MIRNTSIVRTFALAALCFSLPAAAADLPKRGTYSGHYGWTFTGQVQQLGEDRVIYAGVVPGVMFNDKGKGFMHKARVDCTILNDVNKGRAWSPTRMGTKSLSSGNAPVSCLPVPARNALWVGPANTRFPEPGDQRCARATRSHGPALGRAPRCSAGRGCASRSAR